MAHDHSHHHKREPLVASLTLENIVQALHDKGMRVTENRKNILRVLLAAKTPLPLTEIQEQAGKLGSHPDFATVFRVMTALEKLDLAQKVNLGKACSHYELLDPQKHHDHIVCVDCGRVTLIEEDCPVSKVEKKIERQYGYTNLTHSLEFFGTCGDCSGR